MSELIPLVEAFGPTIQGEGALCGQISYFLRFGGCDYLCSWCDSLHSVIPEQIKKNSKYLTREEIVEVAKKLNRHPTLRPWITLSGGNPAIWDLEKVVIGLKQDDMRVAIETQGSMAPEWFDYLDLITCSPKPPSSGMVDRLDLDILDRMYFKYGPGTDRLTFKIVIFTNKDLDFAEIIKKRYPKSPFYLSVGTPIGALEKTVLKNYKWLANQFLERTALWGSVVSPQMHVLLWGHQKGV